MRVLLTIVGLTVGALGLVAYGVGWSKDNDVLLQEGGTLVVAALATLGVAAGLETWRSERRRAREVKQREVYSALVSQLFSRFTRSGTFNVETEAKLRAEVVTWGSPNVVSALRAWISAYDDIVGARTGDVTLSPEQQDEMQKATADVAAAVRDELTVTPGASTDDLIGALFNKAPN